MTSILLQSMFLLAAQAAVSGSSNLDQGNGLMLSGRGMDAVIGHGKDHDPNIGVAAATMECGRREIVMLAIPGLMNSFLSGNADGFLPVTVRRLMFNALAGGRGLSK